MIGRRMMKDNVLILLTTQTGEFSALWRSLSTALNSWHLLGKKLPKRDRFGVHAKLEVIILECLRLSIEATLLSKEKKVPILSKLKIQIEISKHLLRMENELGVFGQAVYLNLAKDLCEVSTMAQIWIEYLTKKAG